MGVSTQFTISFMQKLLEVYEMEDPFVDAAAVDSYEAGELMSGMPASTGYFYTIGPESYLTFFEGDGGNLHTVLLHVDWAALVGGGGEAMGGIMASLFIIFEPDENLRNELNTAYTDFTEAPQGEISVFEGSLAEWTFVDEGVTTGILIQAR